jgi:tetratricopeptide (TPR) repeat protein
MIASPQMSSKRATLLLLFLLLPALSGSALAQSGKGKTSTPATARLEELRAKGSEALFNLDYDSAWQTFKEMTRLFPDDPTGPQMQASTRWLETLNKSRLLQAAIYSTQSFYTGTEDKPDPRVVQDFRELTRQATQLAKARLQRNPRDPQTLYTLGAIETLKASFAATIERRFIAALRDGSSGVDRHREVIKLDPNFHDAELSIGLYDYIVGTLPWGAKLVASIVGARGSKKRGIETLERVAKEAHWERDDARVLLIGLYKREKRFPEALTMSRELQEKYPRNYLFRLETADALISQAVTERQANRIKEAAALETEAAGAFDLLLRARPASGSPARALDLIHFRYGEALLLLGQPEHAAKEFLAATRVNGAEPGLATRAHLRAAQTFDLAGKRSEALTEYRIALSRPNIYDSFEQARRGLKEPYKQTK